MQHAVSAVLLAAGLSRRMGQSKQLLPLDGKPLIRWCIDGLIASGIADIIVVLGPHRAAIEPEIRDLPVTIACNNDPESDMAQSARIGVRAASRASAGILIALCDHPLVRAETIQKLIRCHSADSRRIVIPVYQGRRGHPAVFPCAALSAPFRKATLRDVIRSDSRNIMHVEVLDEGVVTDIDTLEDYRRLCAKQAADRVQSPAARHGSKFGF